MEKSRIKTYVAGFDESIGGGLPEGYVILISGAPGTMKSSFCFSVAYHNALQKGMKTAYVTLEQGKDVLLEHMHSLGLTDPKAYENLAI
ncbi:MAG TPA: RAD55 family ATPase, partial [Thermoplasmata archaeon]|nr:RAD55 family ATPase [Thermoplasmata archaeon]